MPGPWSTTAASTPPCSRGRAATRTWQPDGLGVDPEQGAAALRRVVHGAVEQGLGVALDAGERGLELVADAGQEGPLLGLGPFQPGRHVVEGGRDLGDLTV